MNFPGPTPGRESGPGGNRLRLRLPLEGLHPHLLAVKGGLIARLAALHLDPARTLAAIDAAEATLQEVASGLPFEARHAHAAVVLASYDVVARTGRFGELAGRVPREARQDVLALVSVVPQDQFHAQVQLILNPQFHAAADGHRKRALAALPPLARAKSGWHNAA